jgi:hypothetical protein
VSVFARELGNNVPREKVLACQSNTGKGKSKTDSSPVVPIIVASSESARDSNTPDRASSNSPAVSTASTPNVSPCSVEANEAFQRQSEDVLNSHTEIDDISCSSDEFPSRMRELRSGGKSPSATPILDPNEVVRVDCFEYDSMFIFWQVMLSMYICICCCYVC